ncbi:phage baseplate assembly protein V [Paracoccus sp. TOH]|uniref:Phage baseplate assembly protein V n=1 Tax=Paracoccus simplex TaxID=2086346 RepID=A0ABV7S446_9RHOB|nr:phage baseplate assembly protein V [Paracoccus sp. TOH]WJS85996.1 phage baseplate assembly protein V [Paracoccus sp. TOH]
MNEQTTRAGYFGKYRGTVSNNTDPLQKGRLQVQVPAVYGTNTLNWAMPSVPFAGSGVGFYLIPPVGANIWVEFEGGNIDAPIWSGCFWGEGECPGQTPMVKIIKTQAATITLDEVNSSAPLVIETPSGNRITITAQGITLESSGGAKVELSGPKVTVNSGALEVT